jgi:hypothetical protein
MPQLVATARSVLGVETVGDVVTNFTARCINRTTDNSQDGGEGDYESQDLEFSRHVLTSIARAYKAVRS